MYYVWMIFESFHNLFFCSVCSGSISHIHFCCMQILWENLDCHFYFLDNLHCFFSRLTNFYPFQTVFSHLCRQASSASLFLIYSWEWIYLFGYCAVFKHISFIFSLAFCILPCSTSYLQSSLYFAHHCVSAFVSTFFSVPIFLVLSLVYSALCPQFSHSFWCSVSLKLWLFSCA